jgi:hypothetical protein
MSQTAVAVVIASIFSLASTVGAATITQTINAGPGTTLAANGVLTFYVDAPGLVTFAPGFPLGTSPSCTQSGAGAWGCFFDINDRIVLQTGSITDSAVTSGSAGLGTAGGGNTIVTSTICSGPAQIGFVNCTNNFSPGVYSVLLSLQEGIDTQKLVNSVAVSGTRSLSVTISGPTVLASPEPGSVGLLALALGSFYAVSRRRVRRVVCRVAPPGPRSFSN